MHMLKLLNSGEATELVQGVHFTGYSKLLWVERYNTPGEFEMTASLSSGLREFLPLGCFITHQDTETAMMVEDHHIVQPKDADPTITITGRCFSAFLEERTAGDHQAAFAPEIVEYTVPEDLTWVQLVDIVKTHLVDGVVDPNDGLIGVYSDHICTGSGTSEERLVKQGNVLKAIQEIMKVDDVGLKVIRPNPVNAPLLLRFHRPMTVLKNVRFSWSRGDLENIEYFYSRRKMKTQVRVMGRWLQKRVNATGATHYDRRIFIEDASDIDQQQPSMPTGLTKDIILIAMERRGKQALKNQTGIGIVQADVSPSSQYQFRKDYNIGDLVYVDGDFDASAIFRVVEYAIAEDENGISGHPTLAIPGEDS